MLVIGLTGGIGSGKSTAADAFATKGVPIIDTDVIARDLTEPGEPALNEIRSAFGETMCGPDGRLDRVALRNLVFKDPAARHRLEAILHPKIRERMLQRLTAVVAPYVILVIPLLLETGQDALVDRVLVVDVPESVQVQRVMRRSGLAERDVRAIMSSQVDRTIRRARADDLIDNGGEPGDLGPQVDRLHRLYLALSAGVTPTPGGPLG
jgi:dephospho-CoA kinase